MNFERVLEGKLPLDAKSYGGFFVGEKVLLLASLSSAVFVAGDFVSASKVKKGLEALGKTAEIVSSGRENDDESDKNLSFFAQSVGRFLKGQLDFLIFLPSSVTTKFDANFLKQELTLSVGQEIEIESLCQKLTDFGFERVGYVSSFGQFAVRGDVVDIFAGEVPTRVEFFDEEIEKMLTFDFSTMQTLEQQKSVQILPQILKFGADNVTTLSQNVFFDEPEKIKNECEMLEKSRDLESFHVDMLKFEEIDFSNIKIFSNTQKCEFENETIGGKSYITDFMSLKADLEMFKRSGIHTYLFSGEFFDILTEFLRTNHVQFDVFGEHEHEGEFVHVVRQYFPTSFSFLGANVVGIGTDDMYRSKRISNRSGKESFAYLPKVGDLVVHSFHGVGLCRDIVRMQLSHIEKDYFVLEYKGGALLYVPTEQANLLSAYVGGQAPKLSTLGTSEWARTKQKVKENLKELAVSLAKVYKERQEKRGYVFTRDEALEHAFAEEFEFELTPDQEAAILDVDSDMENGKIMDRLICGDVGFGKTEVAYRAMFKAVYNSKQVAFLCPTTILSEQHFRSTKRRMQNFGVRVEVLNRFKSEKETKDILSRLEKGEIDILIGTHKMLSPRVKFSDLGLLVLDEEQRFGVKDKEKIKSVKSDVDVLTLSATPIPRTLHMSLSGIRDISVIATPPRARLPIQTYISPYSDQLLLDVLTREISRSGKALVLYNKVESIMSFKSHLSTLLPNAKIGVAHGQMDERDLSRVIADLFDDKFDILVSTTLIENGIDLPDLNTLFVVDCDRLGLGQLYQIRGRIGRSDKLAYAYLTYDDGKILTEDAYKRLEAIKEFRELGSGFKIAMRDLEIRGAGNVLGKEQHGHMQKVGYDMYVKLLDEVTRELSGEQELPERETKMELMIDAYVSEEYVPSQEERVLLYTKISHISSLSELNDVMGQMQEVYGTPPIEAKNLCKVALLKNLASHFSVKRIVVNSNQTNVIFYDDKDFVNQRLSKLLENAHVRLKFEDLPILIVEQKGSIQRKIDFLIDLFSKNMGNFS